jgi:hypothetical protein
LSITFREFALGAFIGIAIALWAKLPDHTVDLLIFTESAFGIGLTVLALIVTVGVIQLRAEIEGRFREIEEKNRSTQSEVNYLFDQNTQGKK